MRPDLPARVPEQAKLVPRQRHELVLVRCPDPLRDSGPAHRALLPDEVADDEDGSGHPERLEDRERVREHGAVAVVERDGECARGRRRGHRLLEGRATVATADEETKLLLELLGSDSERRRPAVADAVVAEDEHVGHGLSLRLSPGSPRDPAPEIAEHIRSQQPEQPRIRGECEPDSEHERGP